VSCSDLNTCDDRIPGVSDRSSESGICRLLTENAKRERKKTHEGFDRGNHQLIPFNPLTGFKIYRISRDPIMSILFIL
jgi:hypothetical protein